MAYKPTKMIRLLSVRNDHILADNIAASFFIQGYYCHVVYQEEKKGCAAWTHSGTQYGSSFSKRKSEDHNTVLLLNI